MKLTKMTWLSAGRWMGMTLISLAWAWVAYAQTISTTTVQGTVYLASGAPGSGTLQLSWPAFTTASGDAVAAGRTIATIGANGFVSVSLVPNLGSSPAGLFYTAVYNMSDGTASTEYWVVPAATQATIAQVRAQVMPAAQAVQAVTKFYVDQAIQTASSSLSPSGGAIAGSLTLASLSTASAPTGTPSTNGGTVAAATYYAKIVSVDGAGNLSAAGAESTAVTTAGTTSSIAWTWTAVTGASSYRIYVGTTSGAESSYFTSSTNSATQTATAGTSGTVPTANGTGALTAATINGVTVPNRIFDCGNPVYANLNACLDAAKAYVGNLNAGADKAVDIVIPQGTFSLVGPYTLVSGMHISGVMPRLITHSTSDFSPIDNMAANGGTWIDCGDNICFNGGTGAVEGLKLENLGFQNFTTAMTFGGNNIPGLYESVLTNLRLLGNAVVNLSDKAIEIFNGSYVTMSHVYAKNVNEGLRFVSQNNTGFFPGNSLISDFFVFPYAKSAANGNASEAGISLEVLDTGSGGEPLAYMTFVRAQVNGDLAGDNTGYDFKAVGNSGSGETINYLNIILSDFEGVNMNGFYGDYMDDSSVQLQGTGVSGGTPVVLTANSSTNWFYVPNLQPTGWSDANGSNFLLGPSMMGPFTFGGRLTQSNVAGALLDLRNQTSGATIANFGSGTQHCWLANEGAVGTRTALLCANNIDIDPVDGTLRGQGVVATGTTNVSGCALTGAAGGAFAGKFTSGTAGTCTVTITLPHSATNGNTCWANDLTTTTDKLVQTAGAAGTSVTISGTTASGDVINWGCVAF